nr:MDIS1-interacting receptor like kinase 2-like [Tanacetum cinerariifolium]
MLSLVLSNNRLSGFIPLDLGLLGELSLLNLSMNKLNGSIPSSLGDCSKLFDLNLSNKLTHEIPDQIGGLDHQSLLDLSRNLLTGEIPSALSSPSSLEMLNLSHNKLYGSVPKTFESTNAVWIIDLSYDQWHKPKGNQKLALIISLQLLGALLFDGLTGIIVFYSCRSKRMSIIQLVDEDTHGKIFFSISTFGGIETYHEVLTVTEEFNEAYCIGKGGCESVYKAKLRSGDIVVVKRLHSSFEVIIHDDLLNETRALTRIRHRNIMKLYGTCLHMKVTEKYDVYSFGVLVLEIIKGEHPGDMVAYLTSPMTEKVELKDLVDHRLLVLLLGMKKVLTSILILAIICVNANPELRPTMNDVSHKIMVIKQREGILSKPLGSTALSAQTYSNNNTPRNTNSAYPNRPQTGQRSTFRPGVYCTNFSKEGHSSDECYKLKGYPIGHPLHGKYKPPVARSANVNDNRNAKANLQGQDSTSASTQAESSTNGTYAVFVRIDQLRN